MELNEADRTVLVAAVTRAVDDRAVPLAVVLDALNGLMPGEPRQRHQQERPYWLVPTGVLVQAAKTDALRDVARGYFNTLTDGLIDDCAASAGIEYLLDKYNNAYENYRLIYAGQVHRLMADISSKD